MATFLFNEIIFGPVRSRRLGISLGINLLPPDKKYCNFNCIYCECGWSNLSKIVPSDIPSRENTYLALQAKLIEMSNSGSTPDVITFAGNGEPTMHPQFEEIMLDTIRIRNEYCPTARIAVLCNSTLIHKKKIAYALSLADQNILKLDTVNKITFNVLNKPSPGIRLEDIISRLILFPGRIILQTMFVRGKFENQMIDNSTEEEVEGLIDAYKKIQPESIMIYTYQRDTAAEGLEKISSGELEMIAGRIRKEGFVVEVSA
jgi:wyosine [tRNA(Phe)-imidazoG37] synthetase (radical SAM superfamily)